MRVLDGMLQRLREICAGLHDKRTSSTNVVYSMADIGMSAFAMFFMQSESFLDFQRKVAESRHTSNLSSLFGVDKIPTDAHIRSMLDEVEPSSLQPAFDDAFATLVDEGGLARFEVLDGRLLVALDGTEYFCSQNLRCANCLIRKRSGGIEEYYHSMLAATVVAPGQRHVLHLMPEFIETPDGADKQDCERSATKRWLASEKASVLESHRPVFLGDALFACQPIIGALPEGADAIFVVKPDQHRAVFDAVADGTASMLEVPQSNGTLWTYRWAKGVPMRKDNPVEVDFCELTISRPSGKVTYRNAFITTLQVTKANVAEIVACGRTRWKIENESFNVLKNHGYNLAHNFGHGAKHLAKTFVALNLLAFSFHNVADIADDLWRRARTKVVKRTTFFRDLVSLCSYHVFTSWDALLGTIATGDPPEPQPQLSK
jgi:hypothetical protein